MLFLWVKYPGTASNQNGLNFTKLNALALWRDTESKQGSSDKCSVRAEKFHNDCWEWCSLQLSEDFSHPIISIFVS